jgi:hypothetical protein
LIGIERIMPLFDPIPQVIKVNGVSQDFMKGNNPVKPCLSGLAS